MRLSAAGEALASLRFGEDRITWIWNGKVAFITGGGTGIGFGIARAFSNAGMRLALSYRNEEQRARCTQWFAEMDASSRSGSSST